MARKKMTTRSQSAILNAYIPRGQVAPSPQEIVSERERVRNKLIDSTGRKPTEPEVNVYTALSLEQNPKSLR